MSDMEIFHHLQTGGGAWILNQRGKPFLVTRPRSVVQDHLAAHLVVESLEEIYATLRFNPGHRQESGQS